VVFTESVGKLIDAFVDQIIPPDEWLGGSETGVLNYVDKQLVGPLIRFQLLYKKGILAIQETYEKWYTKKIEELERKIQMSFLEIMEKGKMKDPV